MSSAFAAHTNGHPEGSAAPVPASPPSQDRRLGAPESLKNMAKVSAAAWVAKIYVLFDRKRTVTMALKMGRAKKWKMGRVES